MKKNKSQLAKLLATENIEVQENAVKTASFDVKDRVLTIPTLKEEHKSKHVYDMLVGHEVSHALHTPADGWMNLKDRSDEFRSFVNVIEDARIDKLIQKKYPGLTNDYLLGFKKMYKDNFFGTKGRKQSEFALIDKINMYFKSSKTINFNFDKKENHFVKLVDACKSFEDVQKLAEDILGYCKEELKKNPELKKTYTPDLKGEEEGQEESEDSSNQNLDKNTEEKLQEFLSKETGEDKKEETKDSQVGTGKGAGGDERLVSITNQAFDDAVEKMQDENTRTQAYCEMPKVRLEKLIIPYKKYIRDFAVYDSKLMSFEQSNLSLVKQETKKFLDESSNIVNYLVKEFEMKKNAKMYARASQDKTGVIDPNKLHTYKFAEDIFKKITTVPNQKNHGMIFLLDWSGSMQHHLTPTVEQLLNLVMFCRKINIPFSVYKFMNNGSYDSKLENSPDSPFVNTNKTLRADQSTRLCQMFTHKQSKSDFLRCAQNLHRSARYFNDRYNWRRRDEQVSVPSISNDYYLSSTPLNESLIAMDSIIKKFKNDNHTDKVALVTLTDGSANHISTENGGEINIKLNNRYVKCESSYMGNDKDLTYRLLKYLKKKYDLDTIGFFLASKYRELRYLFQVPYKKEALAMKTFSKDKCIADYNTGYDVYFYVKSDTRVENTVIDETATANKKTLKRMFMSGMKKRLQSRVLLNNFIKMVA